MVKVYGESFIAFSGEVILSKETISIIGKFKSYKIANLILK